MIITLYKNYPFNEDYNQVIHHSVIDTYLQNLPKFTIETYTSSFFRNEDTLIFDENLTDGLNQNENINDYNYMVISGTDTGFKFYCFIESITHNNNNCEVTYKVDVWNTYSNKINVNFGIVSQNLRLVENFSTPYPYNLPVELYSNKKITLQKFESEQTRRFYVLAKIQMYTVSQSGDVTTRTQKIIKLKIDSNTDTISKQGVFNIINLLSINTQQYTFNYNNISYNMQIMNFYIVPSTEITIYDDEVNITIGNSIFSFLPQFADQTEHLSLEHNTKSFIISFLSDDDFKIIGIGHINNMIPIKLTGQSILGELTYIVTYSGDIIFYLSINNSFYDITNDYFYELPVDLATKESLQIQNLNRKLESRNIEITATSGVLTGFNTALTGIGKLIESAVTENYLGIAYGIERTLNSEIESLSTFEKAKTKYEQVNAKLYTSSQAVKLAQNIAYLMQYGMCKFIGDFNNYDDVIKIKSQYGYRTNKIVGTEIYNVNNKEYDILNKPTIQNKSEYDYIKFDTIDIKANLPQNIIRKFNTILLNGVKIYYNTGNI